VESADRLQPARARFVCWLWLSRLYSLKALASASRSFASFFMLESAAFGSVKGQSRIFEEQRPGAVVKG